MQEVVRQERGQQWIPGHGLDKHAYAQQEHASNIKPWYKMNQMQQLQDKKTEPETGEDNANR